MTEKLFLSTFYFLSIFLFINVSSAQNGQGDPCFSRNPRSQCINIHQCPAMINALETSSLSPEAILSMRSTHCGYDGPDPKVCCILNNPPLDTNNRKINSSNSLLPDDCGRDISVRIVGGERTSIDEFPWMVLLEYQKPNGRTTSCGGVLINNRYVLTAAHCLDGQGIPRNWRLLGVRLGEYNTATDPDCIPDSEYTQICAPSVVSIGIEQQIPHEGYIPGSVNQYNDIALLRLSSSVTYTDYIKPICLPKNEILPQRLWVSGWGKTETRSNSQFKLKLAMPISDRQNCESQYGSLGRTLADSQICAGGQRGKDSCRGDSGGPLMSHQKAANGIDRWTIFGVVSFGPSPCGSLNWPGIYTKVSNYTDWILRNIKP